MKTLLILLFSVAVYCQLADGAREYSTLELSVAKRISYLREQINSDIDDTIIRFHKEYDRNTEALEKRYNRSLQMVEEIWENADDVFRRYMKNVGLKERTDCLNKMWNDAKIMKSGVLDSLSTAYSSYTGRTNELLDEVHKNLTTLRKKSLDGIETKFMECKLPKFNTDTCWTSLDKLVTYNENNFITLFPAIRDDYGELFSFAEKRSVRSFYDIGLLYHTRINGFLSNIVKCF